LVSVRMLWRVIAARTGAVALAVPLLLGGATPATASVAGHAMTPSVGIGVNYQYIGDGLEPDGLVRFRCQLQLRCYGPDQIRAAYDIQPVIDSGITGAGRTIVIIDAFSSPTIASDLAAFDAVWGLPAPPSFKIVAPDGLTPFDATDPNQLNWSSEISLDVQWAHAIAPGAAIVLVLAKSHVDADMLKVTRWAIDHNVGDVISQSFGEAEQCADRQLIRGEHDAFEKAREKGMTVFASSGDQGAAQPTCDGSSFVQSASTPASDPLVTAVGGTHLNADFATGAYVSETTWSSPAGATGGGFSSLFRRPGFQAGLQPDRKHRGVPDVALNGDMQGGVVAAWSVLCGSVLNCGPTNTGFFVFGGTSAGTPQWAGIAALGNQMKGHRLGDLNPGLYRIARSQQGGSAFRDVITGTNAFLTFTGFAAGPGWDAVTGLGTPRAATLLSLLRTHSEDDDESE
jgi:subtilase family serine protease